MNWLAFALAVAVLVGVAAGTALIVRNPAWWLGFGRAIVSAALPAVLRVVTKRMPPEEEAAWREAERRGQGDEWLRRRWNRRGRDR